MSTRSTERARFLADIIIGAVEGGTGYWATVTEYKAPEDDPAATYAVLHESLDDDDESSEYVEGGYGHYPAHLLAALGPQKYSATGLRLDVDAVASVFTKLAAGPLAGIPESTRTHLTRASRENDAGELDADDADLVAQLALLGDVVYG